MAVDPLPGVGIEPANRLLFLNHESERVAPPGRCTVIDAVSPPDPDLEGKGETRGETTDGGVPHRLPGLLRA